jgi:hypothetical protein
MVLGVGDADVVDRIKQEARSQFSADRTRALNFGATALS